jgi:uncharacterized damage-inducible protein DinB
VPERVYTPAELLSYLEYCRNKCRATLQAMTDERAAAPCPWDRARYQEDLRVELGYLRRRGLSHGELLLYNMRLVQHHAAQLNLLLRQAGVEPPDWVSVGGRPFDGEARP